MKKILSTILAVFILALAPYALAQYVQPHTATAAPQIIDNPSQQTTINSMQVPRVLCASAVALPLYNSSGWLTNLASYNPIATCTIPAGAMGLNGTVRVTSTFSTPNNTSNSKYVALYFGGQIVGSASLSGANYTFYSQQLVANRNSQSSQVCTNSGGTWGAGPTLNTYSINTALATSVVLEAESTVETGISQTALTGNGTSCSATVASGAYAVGDYIIVASGSGCGSGSQNTGATPVAVTASNGSTTYSYPCTCNGGSPTGGSGQRYSRVQLESYCVELIPGVN